MIISDKLSYVPVEKPIKANIKINMFLEYMKHLKGVLAMSRLTMMSMMGGKTKAKAVEHKDPISEINRPRAGTSSETLTEKKLNEDFAE